MSITGDTMARIAIPWFVLQTTGSALQTGATIAFYIAPIVIGMFFGGTLVDRAGHRRISILSDLASGLMLLPIPLLYAAGLLSFPVLLLLIFLSNLLDAPGKAAQSAMLPELAAAAGVTTERATAWSEALWRGTRLIGAPLAGVLIVVIGAPGVIVIDAVTFLLSAVGVFFIPAALIARPQQQEKKSYFSDIMDGFRFVRQDTLLFSFIIIIAITNMIDAAWGGVTLPVYMDSRFGSEDGAINLGLLVGVTGGFALLGTLIYSGIKLKVSRWRLLSFAFIAVATRFLFFLPLPPLWMILVIGAVNGLLVTPINPIIMSAFYRRTPTPMRARVLGFLSAGVLVAAPFGGLLAGVLLQSVGITATLILYTIIYVAATGSLLFIPAMRDLDAPEPDPEPAQETNAVQTASIQGASVQSPEAAAAAD